LRVDIDDAGLVEQTGGAVHGGGVQKLPRIAQGRLVDGGDALEDRLGIIVLQEGEVDVDGCRAVLAQGLGAGELHLEFFESLESYLLAEAMDAGNRYVRCDGELLDAIALQARTQGPCRGRQLLLCRSEAPGVLDAPHDIHGDSLHKMYQEVSSELRILPVTLEKKYPTG